MSISNNAINQKIILQYFGNVTTRKAFKNMETVFFRNETNLNF